MKLVELRPQLVDLAHRRRQLGDRARRVGRELCEPLLAVLELPAHDQRAGLAFLEEPAEIGLGRRTAVEDDPEPFLEREVERLRHDDPGSLKQLAAPSGGICAAGPDLVASASVRRPDRFLAVLWLVMTVAVAAPVAAVGGKSKVINACSLIKPAEVRRILASPVDIRRGSKITNCIFRGGSFAPVIGLTSGTGRRGFNNLIRAAGVQVRPVKGLGTQAVTYDYTTENPVVRSRAVVVRKGANVLQLSTNGIGLEPPGLPTLSQLVALARVAVARI